MISSELRDKVHQFIEDQITIFDLEEWVVPRLQFFIAPPFSTESEVAAAIELGLAEIGEGFRTVDEFRHLLEKILQEQTAITAHFPQNEWTESGTSETSPIIRHSYTKQDNLMTVVSVQI